jgi:peptidyl-prolyl cis-trans isomerase D
MISWIQRTFQHHFQVIFAIVLAVTVLSFVFTIGSTPGIGRAEHRAVTQNFFGYNLASQEEKDRIGEDARLSATLKYAGQVSADQMQYYAFHRLAALHFADEMHIPQATPAELKDFIQSLRMFRNSDGRFDVARYDSFRTSLTTRSPVTQADIVRILSEDVRVNKVEMYLAGPGYVMPRDVVEVLVKGDTVWSVSTATVDYAAFDPGVKPSESDIAKFFTENAFRYTIAPRVSADCVEFPAEAYVPQMSATDGEVRDFYAANPARFPKPASAKSPLVKADPAADFAAVQPQVKAALLLEKAKRSSIKAASDFAYAIYDGKVSRGASLDSYLSSHGLKTRSLAPFTLEAGPAELGGSREVAKAAFELSASRFYSEGIPTENGALVLIWKESLPSREPLLAEVRDKVVADAFDAEKRRRFIEFGQTFKAAVDKRLKSGEPFEKAATEAAGPVNLAVRSYPPFTLRTMPQGLDPSVFNALENLDKGAVSAMQPTAEKGLFVYAADKKPPAVDPSNPRFMQVWAQLAMTFAQTDSAGILTDVVDREVKRMEASVK